MPSTSASLGIRIAFYGDICKKKNEHNKIRSFTPIILSQRIHRLEHRYINSTEFYLNTET